MQTLTARDRPIDFPSPWGALVLVALLWLGLAGAMGGCTMTETEQRSSSGAGIGAAAGAAGGALIGLFAGVPVQGAAVGAAAGAAVGGASGYVVDQVKKREAAQAENAQLKQENEQLRQQQSEQSQTAN